MLEKLLEQNRQWADDVVNANPTYFKDLSKQQNPKYLWIGCSDSRVPANQIVGLEPGEMFVHRNIANLVIHSDLNSLSVIQYAVEHLKVEHIIVCGHYGCGGVKAALSDGEHGIVDNWLREIKNTVRHNRDELAGLEGSECSDRLCEINVVEQVANVAQTTIVQSAWAAGQELSVHGWIYGLKDGRVRNLEVSVSNNEELKDLEEKTY
ncbi:MAG: carbonate dehydratase [Lentisphaeraceae bacterium]|nr:carbonate dehydratase [Lentisphaeraceae bacterium]